ncbi:MAG: thiamine pyrophosphate-dependent enzyme [Bacteroidota bacterium]|nr:thiamine pyrophosphate-dependent enzyme [Bacteroidota bacterium]
MKNNPTEATTKRKSASKSKAAKSLFDKKEVLNDYRIACESREVSLLGRREVLTGKAKFGIFGDGKEIPQLAMAKVFREGDWRSGYYRDQTFMFAAGMMKLEEFFAQLYGDTDLDYNPQTAGRLMNNHFASRSLDEKGMWKDLTKIKNSSADTSPTASQMPRLVGLAHASRIFRNVRELKDFKKFSKNGDEVAFGTIGDASAAEGHFWESINAAGVLQIPMAVSIWDDGYWHIRAEQVPDHEIRPVGSTPGFKKDAKKPGFYIFKVKAWDYAALVNTYRDAIGKCRKEHVPVIIHAVEQYTSLRGIPLPVPTNATNQPKG